MSPYVGCNDEMVATLIGDAHAMSHMQMSIKKQKAIVIVIMILLEKVSKLIALHDNECK